MRSLLLIPALLSAGCATTQTDPRQVSNWDICAYTMNGGNDAAVAQAEANRRGLDCAPYYQAILARRQAQSQALQNAANYFAPRPAPAPTMMNCSSYRIGNTVQTDCH